MLNAIWAHPTMFNPNYLNPTNHFRFFVSPAISEFWYHITDYMSGGQRSGYWKSFGYLVWQNEAASFPNFLLLRGFPGLEEKAKGRRNIGENYALARSHLHVPYTATVQGTKQN